MLDTVNSREFPSYERCLPIVICFRRIAWVRAPSQRGRLVYLGSSVSSVMDRSNIDERVRTRAVLASCTRVVCNLDRGRVPPKARDLCSSVFQVE